MTLEKKGTSEISQDGSHPLPEKGKQHEHEWHALEAGEVLEHLKVHDQGLTSEEARRRLDFFGPNQLKEAPRPGFLQMLWEQLNNFVVILLIVASVISALLGDYVEAAAIMAIVVLNAVLGIVQEQRAEEALAALKKLAAPDAQVMRDGRRVSGAGLLCSGNNGTRDSHRLFREIWLSRHGCPSTSPGDHALSPPGKTSGVALGHLTKGLIGIT